MLCKHKSILNTFKTNYNPTTANGKLTQQQAPQQQQEQSVPESCGEEEKIQEAQLVPKTSRTQILSSIPLSPLPPLYLAGQYVTTGTCIHQRYST